MEWYHAEILSNLHKNFRTKEYSKLSARIKNKQTKEDCDCLLPEDFIQVRERQVKNHGVMMKAIDLTQWP